MSEDERSYFQLRAEEEIGAAQSAEHPDAARAHYLLAGYYLDLVHNPEAAAPWQPALRGEQGCREATSLPILTSRSARPSTSPKAMRIGA